MITFIVWLRCLAAILITNAHYIGIYPIDLIANGGLIGDIIFFSVSGYCLTNLKTTFCQWYGKRLSRIMPAVILISLIYFIMGQYDFSVYALGTENTLLYQMLAMIGITYPKLLSWLMYPTYYHFVASILILYIPYYFILKNRVTRKHLPIIMMMFGIIYFMLYLFAYDKSYYHIDVVREPFIRFLFLESMLLGAWFKLNDDKLRNKGKPIVYACGTIISFVLYFLSKILLSRGATSQLQIINQIIIIVLLFFIMRWFTSIDSCLEKVPNNVFKVVDFVAKLTLEIYLVQYILIDIVREFALVFPFNWIVLTISIVVVALMLHIVTEHTTGNIRVRKTKKKLIKNE